MQDWARAAAGVSALSTSRGKPARKARRRERNRALLWPRQPGPCKRITGAFAKRRRGVPVSPPCGLASTLGVPRLKGSCWETTDARSAPARRHTDGVRRVAGGRRRAGAGARGARLGKCRHGRRRHPGVPAAGQRPHPERQPSLPERLTARQGPRAGAGAPGAGGQRRQVLRPLRGGRWRGGAAGRARPLATRRRLRRDAGTGVGGGIVVDGRVLTGENGAATEWSHTTLPFAAPDRPPPTLASAVTRAASNRSSRAAAWRATYRALGGGELRGETMVSARTPATTSPRAPSPSTRTGWPGRWHWRHQPHPPARIVLGGGVSNNARVFAGVPKSWSATPSPRSYAPSWSAPPTATPAASEEPPGCGRGSSAT